MKLTIEVDKNQVKFIESVTGSGRYKTKNDVIKAALLLLKEKQTALDSDTLRHLIDEGENTGVTEDWGSSEVLRHKSQ